MQNDTQEPNGARVPLPPPDANIVTTVCDYCIVGCGYKVYTWPEGTEGGTTANANALGVDFPVEQLSGHWISQNQHGVCQVDGESHHVVVLPDPDSRVVNIGGNHSIRGGCLAGKPYHPERPTRDRLQQPMVRVAGKLLPVSWDVALEAMARVSQHVIDSHGRSAWGMKTFSYQYFENTYAISKLAFESIQTPAWAPHDKPGPGNDTAGIDDAGLVVFSASYDDWGRADVIFLSGTDPYETKTVTFTDWMMKGQKLIMVLPRRTTGVAYAEQNGGLFLQIIPGTDSILHLALARLIWRTAGRMRNSLLITWQIAGKSIRDSVVARGIRLGNGGQPGANSGRRLNSTATGCWATRTANWPMQQG